MRKDLGKDRVCSVGRIVTRFAQERSPETTQDSFLSSRRLETVGMLGRFCGENRACICEEIPPSWAIVL